MSDRQSLKRGGMMGTQPYKLPAALEREARQQAIETWNWTTISGRLRLGHTVLKRILEDAWVADMCLCSQCGGEIHYRYHVDYPRHYYRCHECAAREWNAGLCCRRAS